LNILDFYSEKKYYIALKILKKLNEIGFKAYFVGGSVRDALLGYDVKDIDIATNAKEDIISNVFKNYTIINEKYKVTKLKIEDEVFEISSFRKEGEYLDARHPVFTKTGTIEEDAARRDFTMNAIYFDPNLYEFIDFYNGLADINNKLIRTIGNPRIRFQEDRLRVLRAIRFSSQLGFKIETLTYNAILNTPDKLKGISKERLLEEFNKILLSRFVSNGFTYLFEFNLLNLILPELIKLKTTFYIGSISYWDCLMRLLDNVEYKDMVLVWSFLLLFLKNYFDITVILKSFNFSNSFIFDIEYILNNHEQLLKPEKINKVELKRIINYRLFEKQLLLLELYLKVLNINFKAHEFLLNEKQNLEKNFPPAFINGSYLMQKGLIDNKKIKVLLDSLYLAQLEGKIKNKEEAELYLYTLIKK